MALAKTAVAFSVPVVVSTSATKVYSGPLMPPLRAVLKDVVPIERRNMNLWEDEAAKAAVVATGQRTLVVAGLLTEACVSFPVLSALAEGYRVPPSGCRYCSSSSAIGLAARRTRPRARSWSSTQVATALGWTTPAT